MSKKIILLLLVIAVTIIFVYPNSCAGNHIEFRAVLPPEESKGVECVKLQYRGEELNVEKSARLTEKDIERVEVARVKGDADSSVVNFKFTEPGKRKLHDFTQKFSKQRIAIIMEGEVIAAPHIFEPVASGEVVLVGVVWDEGSLERIEKRMGVRTGRKPGDYEAAQKDISNTIGQKLRDIFDKMNQYLKDKAKEEGPGIETEIEIDIESNSLEQDSIVVA